MAIEDVTGLDSFETYEHKPQPTPADIQAKKMTNDFVWTCPTTGTSINGKAGDYLVSVESLCVLIKEDVFEQSWQLKT